MSREFLADEWVEKVVANLSLKEKIALLSGKVSVQKDKVQARQLAHRHTEMVVHISHRSLRWLERPSCENERWSEILSA